MIYASKKPNGKCDAQYYYMDHNETYDGACTGTESLLMNSLFGAAYTEFSDTSWSYPAHFPQSTYSKFGIRIEVDAKDGDFGFNGVGEDLRWLQFGGPCGYFTSWSLSKSINGKFNFEILRKNNKYLNSSNGNEKLMNDWTFSQYPGIKLGAHSAPITQRMRAKNTPGGIEMGGRGTEFIIPEIDLFNQGSVARSLNYRCVVKLREANYIVATFNIKIRLDSGSSDFIIDISGAWATSNTDTK